MTYAVEVENLEKKFGSFVAVNKITFNVPPGQIYGFLGPNGAGKSTTIRMLCGILTPTFGKGFVSGFDMATESEKIKSSIGYMSQKFSLYEDLTVEENIHFWSGIYGVSGQSFEKKREWVIEIAGLKEHKNTRCSYLSGGWKQRLALGCALVHSPKIVFLDEPTSGVDPNSRREFWNLIYEISSQGVTVFVTTHYMDEAEYFDKIAFIYKGELIAEGSPDTLKKEVMKEKIVAVQCPFALNALDDLKEMHGVKEVNLFGQGLHVIAKEPEAVVLKVRQFFEKRGIPFDQIEVIDPTLEDVFISLIESHDQKGEII
jgi:ABC-2 type transport system ATP-binding protein